MNHRKSTSSHAAVVMPEALSGDVRRVCMVRWAQRPLPVSLQPPVKVGAPALLSPVLPQLPQVRLIRSQIRGTANLRTQEWRIQNTSHEPLPPTRGAAVKWRRSRAPQTTKEMFPEALCTWLQRMFSLLSNFTTCKKKTNPKKPAVVRQIHLSQQEKASTKVKLLRLC